ncbi:LysR substrate-binding domain-containing protein [Roseovarius sp. 2305UL8-3]|uniref:LysR substrate-binding domain-containing protein n=1 Tax=Roseovarius conchicola TaxID=3121636 RepID=UPI0035298E36
MRHSQLKAFHHVALHGGFSAAAEALNLTQPAISEQVRNLEQSYDVLLFQRDRKKVTLTETGTALLKISLHYFEVEQQMAELLSESSAAVSGELRIVADSAYHIADILSSFQEKFPRITISVMTGNTEEVVSRLRSYDAEIGVLGSLTPGKDMESISLGSTEIFGFCANSFDTGGKQTLSMSDLQKYPLIFRENGSKTRMTLEQKAQQVGITLKPAIIAEGREAVRAIVAAGTGIGFVSDAEFGSEPHFRKLPLEGASIHMDESIVYLSQRRDVRLIRAFREIALGSGETM